MTSTGFPPAALAGRRGLVLVLLAGVLVWATAFFAFVFWRIMVILLAIAFGGIAGIAIATAL
jgi:hypothetical protein